jgi:hypothetical protein
VKFRNGLIIGLGVGYYLGARAGRERYVQIERVLDRVRAVPGFADARDKVSGLYAGGRDIALSRLDDATGGAASSILDFRDDDDLTTELHRDDFDAANFEASFYGEPDDPTA